MRDISTKRIGVVLIGLRGMVEEIIEGVLGDAPDVDVRSGPGVADVLEQTDVAILAGVSEELPGRVHGLLLRYPPLKVVTVEADGRSASLYDLRPHRTSLGKLSPQALLRVVRRATS